MVIINFTKKAKQKEEELHFLLNKKLTIRR